MKKIMPIIFIITFLFSCKTADKIGQIDPLKPHLLIEMSFNPESYPRIITRKYPQLAVWISHKETGYAKTIYATGSGAKDDWFGAKKRPSAVPVWYGIRKDEGSLEIDAVTGATPSGEIFTIAWMVPEELIGKTADVYIEGNVSFDYNEHYVKTAEKDDDRYSDVNGQPSVIWKGTLTLADSDSSVTPDVAGHGHVLGKDHAIDRDMSGITSASGLFNYISIKYRSGGSK